MKNIKKAFNIFKDNLENVLVGTVIVMQCILVIAIVFVIFYYATY